VSCECLFAWYWLAELCRNEQITFVLGHALYMKAIHGGKTKSDKIDSEKIARLLRGGMLPQAYVYPPEIRATRDLLRRRMKLVRLRGQATAHVTNTFTQYNLTVPGKKLSRASNRVGIADHFTDEMRHHRLTGRWRNASSGLRRPHPECRLTGHDPSREPITFESPDGGVRMSFQEGLNQKRCQ